MLRILVHSDYTFATHPLLPLLPRILVHPWYTFVTPPLVHSRYAFLYTLATPLLHFWHAFLVRCRCASLGTPLVHSCHTSLDTLSARSDDRAGEKRKTENHDTQDSHVVPHHGTDWAAPCLTTQIGRDAVLSRSYGRGYLMRSSTPQVQIGSLP